MRPLYDWPNVIKPRSAVARFISTVEEGRVSRASYETAAAIPGGRISLQMDFDYQRQAAPPLEMYSWLCSKLKGNIFRIPLWQTAQVARDEDLGVARNYLSRGIPFDTEQPFSTGYGFKFVPTADVASAALEGESTITVTESRWPGLIRYGKWVGIGFGAYHVDDIDRDGATVTVTVSPPLRRDVAAGEFVSLRPSIVCQAKGDISSFVGMFEPANLVRPGSLQMMEVIDERFL